jgi:hypothetical protein
MSYRTARHRLRGRLQSATIERYVRQNAVALNDDYMPLVARSVETLQ